MGGCPISGVQPEQEAEITSAIERLSQPESKRQLWRCQLSLPDGNGSTLRQTLRYQLRTFGLIGPAAAISSRGDAQSYKYRIYRIKMNAERTDSPGDNKVFR